MTAPVELARAHVAAVLERYPDLPPVDLDVWVRAVLAHLEPLPADRPWRLLAARRRLQPVAQLAPAVARRLQPPAGHQPQPECPTYCAATHDEAA